MKKVRGRAPNLWKPLVKTTWQNQRGLTMSRLDSRPRKGKSGWMAGPGLAPFRLANSVVAVQLGWVSWSWNRKH